MLSHPQWSMYSGYGAEMTADSIIAVYMSVLLVRMRTGLRSSDSLVQTFVMYSINTSQESTKGRMVGFTLMAKVVCVEHVVSIPTIRENRYG